MEITFIGHAAFKLRGKKATIVTDPFDPAGTGLKFPKIETDIVTISHEHDDHNFLEGIAGSPVVFRGPGEYEASGVHIMGVLTYHDGKRGAERGRNTVYRMEMDGMVVTHCGDLGHIPDEAQLEQMGGTDILLVPAGGTYTLDPSQAANLTKKLEPSVVIPMHYFVEGMNRERFDVLKRSDDFVKEIGKEPVKVTKYSVTKDKLPEELTVVVIG